MRRRKYAETLCCLLAAVFVMASTPCGAAQTRVVMKDGRLYIGSIFPTKSVVETSVKTVERDSSPVQSEKILAIDDQLRRIYVPKNNVANLILDRGAGEGEAEVGLEGTGGTRLQGGGVFDVLGLVEHDHTPVDTAEGGEVATEKIEAGNDDGVLIGTADEGLAEVAVGSVVGEEREAGGEAGGLMTPVGDQ